MTEIHIQIQRFGQIIIESQEDASQNGKAGWRITLLYNFELLSHQHWKSSHFHEPFLFLHILKNFLNTWDTWNIGYSTLYIFSKPLQMMTFLPTSRHLNTALCMENIPHEYAQFEFIYKTLIWKLTSREKICFLIRESLQI